MYTTTHRSVYVIKAYYFMEREIGDVVVDCQFVARINPNDDIEGRVDCINIDIVAKLNRINFVTVVAFALLKC